MLDDFGHCAWSEEHALSHRAIKVSLALDGAIILPRFVLELDPNPSAWCKRSGPDESNDRLPAVENCDDLARAEGRTVGHGGRVAEGPSDARSSGWSGPDGIGGAGGGL